MINHEEMQGQLEEMKRKLAIMEWDVQRDQINPAKRVKYNKLKEDYVKLQEEFKRAQ